jgi:hypothetical protein
MRDLTSPHPPHEQKSDFEIFGQFFFEKRRLKKSVAVWWRMSGTYGTCVDGVRQNSQV